MLELRDTCDHWGILRQSDNEDNAKYFLFVPIRIMSIFEEIGLRDFSFYPLYSLQFRVQSLKDQVLPRFLRV